jgi:hypothetical protein
MSREMQKRNCCGATAACRTAVIEPLDNDRRDRPSYPENLPHPQCPHPAAGSGFSARQTQKSMALSNVRSGMYDGPSAAELDRMA